MAKMDRKLIAKTQQYEVSYFARKHKLSAADARAICRPEPGEGQRTR